MYSTSYKHAFFYMSYNTVAVAMRIIRFKYETLPKWRRQRKWLSWTESGHIFFSNRPFDTDYGGSVKTVILFSGICVLFWLFFSQLNHEWLLFICFGQVSKCLSIERIWYHLPNEQDHVNVITEKEKRMENDSVAYFDVNY